MTKLRMHIALAALAASMAVPAAAHASTAGIQLGGGEDATTLTFQAAPGEANKPNIVVTGQTATIDDPGSTITPGEHCAPVNAKKVTCDTGNAALKIDVVVANLGDGGDTFDLSGAGGTVKGEAGNDTLRGGELTDVLDGGGGTDTLRGNAGNDILTDGDTSGTANSDTLDGGDGDDGVRYSTRTAPVTVDLADAAGDGQAGENDHLTSIQSATGGDADDKLFGDEGPNGLGGGKGNDTIDGRGGDDLVNGEDGNDDLTGSAGVDDIEAGSGDDQLTLNNPTNVYDRILSCGAGSDVIVGLGPSPSVGIDCERGNFGFGFVPRLKPKKVTKTYVTLTIPCPDAFRVDGVCKGSIVIEPKSAYLRDAATRKKQRYGTAKFKFTKSATNVRVDLNSAGRKQLRKSAFKLQITVNLKETATKQKQAFAWTDYLVRSFL
jgi:hypothetical protein